MNNNLKKYLNSKEKKTYTKLDLIFEMFLNGIIKSKLLKYNFYDVEMFSNFKKGVENSLQINFKYNNLLCTVDFYSKIYSYNIYTVGASFEEVRSSFIESNYDENFTINNLFKNIDYQLKNHIKLKDNSRLISKKRMYKVLSNVCLITPSVIILIMIIYVLIKRDSVEFSPYWIILFIIAIVSWLIFYVKAAKIK